MCPRTRSLPELSHVGDRHTSGRSMGASQTRPGPPADLRLRWHQLERSLGEICVLLKVSRPDETIRVLTTVLCFLILEIWAEEQNWLDWSGELQPSHKTFKLPRCSLKALMWNLDACVCVFLQYYPLPPHFAKDNTSFYKVMSDDRGYKHLHYVNGVSFLLFWDMRISELRRANDNEM